MKIKLPKRLELKVGPDLSKENPLAVFKHKKIAAFFEEDYGRKIDRYSLYIDKVLNLTTYNPEDVIVDLGCGTGFSTQRIRIMSPDARIIAVDPSEAMLEYTRKKFEQDKNIEFKIAPVEELSTVVQGADKIVSVNAFDYFLNPQTAFQEIYKALKQNGEYIFNVTIRGQEIISMDSYFLGIVGKLLSEEHGRQIILTRNKELRQDYAQSDFQAFGQKNGFSVEYYEEDRSTYSENNLRKDYEKILGLINDNLRTTIGSVRAEHLLVKAINNFQRVKELSDWLVGKDIGESVRDRHAYVHLRKI